MSEKTTIFLSCKHSVTLVDPSPLDWFECPRCGSLETMTFAVPA